MLRISRKEVVEDQQERSKASKTYQIDAAARQVEEAADSSRDGQAAAPRRPWGRQRFRRASPGRTPADCWKRLLDHARPAFGRRQRSPLGIDTAAAEENGEAKRSVHGRPFRSARSVSRLTIGDGAQ